MTMKNIMDYYDNGLDYTLSVTSAFGIESVTKKELSRLGFCDVPAENGRFDFCGKASDVAKLNINLRTADRVYIKLADFKAESFDELFDGVYAVCFERFISKEGKVIVDGKCVKSKLFAVSACQSIVKKAISKRLCEKYKINILPESGEEYRIVFSIYKDVVSVLLDTSGVGLHKRGYRDLVGIAPIKETLSAGLLLLSDFYWQRPFADPFCGSGTFAIEGAMIALDIAPGINRDFCFNKWKFYDKKYYKQAKEEALDKEKRDREIEFFASDVDKKAIKLARHHAENLGLDKKIRFSVCDVKDFYSEHPFGTIVTNPPYGDRVYGIEEAKACYSSFGKALNKMRGWSVFAITEAKFFEREFGRKADRVRKIFNSDKQCNFYYYYGKGDR